MSAAASWAVAYCTTLEPQAPPLSLHQPYAVVDESVVVETFTDPTDDSETEVSIAQTDITFPYRGFDGALKVGRGRLFLPDIAAPPEGGMPLAISMHYELGGDGAH
jgi:hypothetical protein